MAALQGKAPKFGESARAADASISSYFKLQQRAAAATRATVRAERLHASDGGESSSSGAEREATADGGMAQLQNSMAHVDHIGKVPVDAVRSPSPPPSSVPRAVFATAPKRPPCVPL